MNDKTDYIPLEHAKNLIITALDHFDPELATRATSVLYHDKRLNIVENPEVKTDMMQCRPAGVTIKDLKAVDMYIPDFAQRFGPHFTRQNNPTKHAIVDFEYDGSPRSVVWLAHEVGHAMGDDLQRQNGRSYKDFSPGEHEEQAYFVQHIVSQYLKDHLNRPDVRDEDLGQDTLTMSWERATQYTNADKVYKTALASPPDERQRIALKALDQRL